MLVSNTEIIIASCIIQTAVWIAMVYSYKYCYYDIDKLLYNSAKLISSVFGIKDFEYVIFECYRFLDMLANTKYVVLLFVVLDAILIVFGIISYDAISVTGILLIITTQIVVGYYIILNIMLKRALLNNIEMFSIKIAKSRFQFVDSDFDD